MGVRDRKREILTRLDSKTLDAKFLTEISVPRRALRQSSTGKDHPGGG
jgi:hypothetical protein